MCLCSNYVIKKDFETGLFHVQSFSFEAYKMYISAILTHLVLKLYKNKKGTADAADKGKMYSFCSKPEIPERNFCDDLEIRLYHH